jgi:hypothetical protein
MVSRLGDDTDALGHLRGLGWAIGVRQTLIGTTSFPLRYGVGFDLGL